MGRTKKHLEDMQTMVYAEIMNYLEDCEYDISDLIDEEKVDEIAWEIANDKMISAMEDEADAKRELDWECRT